MAPPAQRAKEQVDASALRVAFITDLLTPYMAPVFEALAARCDLTVLFGSHTGSRAMAWSLPTPSYRHEIVGGPVIRRAVDAADIYPSPRVMAELRRARPQVVISGGFSLPSLYAGAYCTARRARLLIQSDGTAASEAALGRDQRLTRAALARLAHGAVGNSTLAVARFRELGFGTVFLAPHSSNLAPYLAIGRARLEPTGGGIRVVTVARLLPNKGIDLLIEAVAAARRDGAELTLTIVGDGTDDARLRALATQRALRDVEWRGFVEPADLPAELARADVFAFPTLGDTFGIALLEAAAAGLPLVASPHAGATRDLVEGVGTGLVIDPREVTTLAGGLASLARDPQLRGRLGRAAHAVAAQRTPDRAAEAYVDAARAVARA